MTDRPLPNAIARPEHLTDLSGPIGTPAREARIPHRRAVAIVYSFSMFMSIMDTQIVNVALTTMSRDFRVPIPSVQWVVTAYLMAIAVAVPASGWIGDRFGTRRVYLGAVGAFTGASLLCSLAQNLPELVVTRILQGLGGGMMIPVGMAMLYRAYPPEARIGVARLITRVSVLGPALAPVVGGVLVTYASWRWIFTINVPVGLMVLLFGSRFLVEHREASRGRFDLPGAILGSAGLGLLLYSVGSGPTLGWSSEVVLGTLAAALVSLAAFVGLELGRADPVLNLRLLANRLFRRCCSLIVCSTTAFFGSLIFTALYLQEGRGLSALNSGLSTFPEAIGIGFTSQLVARVFPRIGPRRIVMVGFTVLGVMCFLLSRAGTATSLWDVRALTLGLGAGSACVMMPIQASAFTQVVASETGHAAAIFNTLQRALSSLGVALLSTVLALAAGSAIHVRPPVSAFHWVFRANVAFALLGVSLALRIPDADASAAMRPRG